MVAWRDRGCVAEGADAGVLLCVKLCPHLDVIRKMLGDGGERVLTCFFLHA